MSTVRRAGVEPSDSPTETVRSTGLGVIVTVVDDRSSKSPSRLTLVVRIVPLMGDFVAEGGRVLDVW